MNRAFRKFQQSGDRAALAEVFDACSPSLLCLARRWVTNGVEPEDLVQATFLRAIEHRDRFDGSRPLFLWLRGILNNVCRESVRASSRLSAVQGTTRAVPEPPEILVNDEFLELLANTLAALPETYREVITQRIVHGRRTSEIARQLRCPVATVRTRLQRGMQILRSGLPAGLTATAVALLVGARGLAQTRVAVLARSGASPASVTLALKLAGVAAIVLLSSAIGAWRGDRTSEDDPDLSNLASVERPSFGRPNTAQRDSRVDAQRTLVGRVATMHEVPVDGARVVLYRGEAADRDVVTAAEAALADGRPPYRRLHVAGSPIASAPVTADGTFSLALPACRYVRVTLEHSFYSLVQPRPITIDGANTIDIGTLDAWVGGRVRGRAPRGVRVVELLATPDTDDMSYWPASARAFLASNEGLLRVPVEDDGTFEFSNVWVASQLRVNATSGARLWMSKSLAISPGVVRTVRLRATPAAVVSLRVVAGGRVLTGARVRLSGLEVAAQSRTGTTDQRGTCALAPAVPGRYLLRVEHDRHVAHEMIEVLAAGRQERRIELTPGRTLTGRVCDAACKPIAGASVYWRPASDEDFALPHLTTVRTDSDGYFGFRNLPLRTNVDLRAEHAEFATGYESDVAPGRADVTLALRRLVTLRGVVVDDRGEPVPDFEVSAARRGGGFSRRRFRNTKGHFQLRIAMGSRTLCIRAVGFREEERAVTTDVGATDLGRIRLVRDSMATLTGTVRVDGIGPLDGHVELKARGVFGPPRIAPLRAGRFSIDNLEPGVFEVRLRTGAGPVGLAKAVELRAGDNPPLRCDLAAGSLSGSVVGPSGAIGGVPVLLVADCCTRFGKTDADGRFWFGGLPSGRYTLRFEGERGQVGSLSGLALRHNERRDALRIDSVAGVDKSVEVFGPDGEPVVRAIVLALGLHGRMLGQSQIAFTDTRGRAMFRGLPPEPIRFLAGAQDLAVSYSRRVEPGEAAHRIALEAGSRCQLEITDEAGNRLEGARLRVRRPGQPWIPGMLFRRPGPRGGMPRFGLLPSGTFEVEVSHPRARFVRKVEGGRRHARLQAR